MRRIRPARVVAGAVAAVLAGGCASAGVSAPAHRAPPSGVLGTELDSPVPASLLRLPLLDSRGRRTTLGSFAGRAVVVSDMSTLCQETCAIGTAAMLQAARAVDADGLGAKVEFLSVTIDPTRDDRRHVAAYRRLFGPLPNWETLTGSPDTIGRLWDRLGVWRREVHVRPPYARDWLTGRPLTTDIQHTDDLVFIDGDQRFRFLIDGPGSVPASAIPAPIYGFMDGLGHRNIRNPSDGAWSADEVVSVLRWLLRDEGGS